VNSNTLWASIVSLTKTRLVQNAAIYTGAEVLNKAIPFVLLPVLTRYLTPADYGVVATFTAFVSILAVFVGLGAHGAVTVNFFRLHKQEISKYIANVLLILLISGGATLFLLFLLRDLIVTKLSITSTWIFVGLLLAAGQFITSINLILWQLEERATAYAVYQVAQTTLNVIVTLILVVGFRLGWFGRLTGTAVATVLFAIMSLGFISWRGYVRFEFNRSYIKDALDFSVPLIPHDLSGWFRTGVDRFLLASILGMSATGLYAVGYQVGLVIGVIAAAVNLAWRAFLFRKLIHIGRAGKIKLVKTIYLYCAVILFLSVSLGVLSPLLVKRFLGTEFNSSSGFVTWISLGYAFDGMYYMVVNQIFFMKKTKWLAAMTFSSGLIHVILSYVLIKLNGSIGAAQATTFSFLVSLIMVWALSARVYPLPWLFWRQEQAVAET
jgi:O-antigen/teichoic acid export membrane protein